MSRGKALKRAHTGVSVSYDTDHPRAYGASRAVSRTRRALEVLRIAAECKGDPCDP